MINIFKKVAGIYDNQKRQNQLSEIKKTVLVNVLESKKYIDGNDRYKQLINNYLCYISHHKFISILYIIESNATLFESMAKTIHSYNSNVYIIEYPYHLFWTYVR